jgi:hypothetical protein
MWEVKKRKRRMRGPSPYGDFESSKATAKSIAEEERAATRKKSEALKAQRLARAEDKNGN